VNDLLASVEAVARHTFGRAPEWRFLVPGRLEVLGKHTDYAGGRSLVAAVPRGFAIAAHAAHDGTVDIIDAVSAARYSCRLGERVAGDSSGWSRYAATVVRRLARNFPSAELSCRIVLGSNLPSAAGISSSSALVVGTAEALIARGRIEETREWQAAIRSLEDRASYFGCIENGSSFGTLEGDAGVGTHGGSEDHAAIVLSQEGSLSQFSFSPLRRERIIRMPSGWTFVVLSSGVRASKTGRVREVYNQLAAEGQAIKAHDGSPLGPRLEARLRHLRAEDARVAEAAEAFARGDIAKIGKLAADSQQDAERCLGNQVPQTVSLVALALEHGAAAASAFGAGWGGSVWALVPEASAAAFLDEWTAAYRRTYPRLESTGFISPPFNGLQRL
jgi:galactokinase